MVESANTGEETPLLEEHFDGVFVLFLDIVGFTPLSADIGPHQTMHLVNGFFGRLLARPLLGPYYVVGASH